MRAVVLALSLARPAPVAPVAPLPVLPAAVLPVLPAPSLAPRLSAPVLPQGRAYSAVQEDTDAGLLRNLAESPPKAVVLDYDNTLADRGENGLSLPVSDDLIRAISRLLERGVPVILATSRHYELSGAPFPMDVKPFVERIAPRLRRHLLISGGVGSELVGFDARGRAVVLWSRGWRDGEAEAIRSHAAAAAASIGAEVQTILSPGQLVLRLPKGDTRGPALARALQERLRDAGFLYKVLQNKEFVYFSRSDKGEGLRGALAALRSPVRERDLLVIGDEFGLPDGGDAALAQAAPDARLVSVGDARSTRMPPGVHRLRAKGGSGVLLLLTAVLRGLGL